MQLRIYAKAAKQTDNAGRIPAISTLNYARREKQLPQNCTKHKKNKINTDEPAKESRARAPTQSSKHEH